MANLNHEDKYSITTPQDGVEICLSDSKTYWRPRATVDIVIAHHIKVSCYEIIVYNPELDKETPRLYIDEQTLRMHIDPVELARKVAEMKEHELRCRHSFHLSEATKGIEDKMIMNYLYSRINIDTAVDAQTASAVLLSPQTGDTVVDEITRRLDIILLTPPKHLIPLALTFVKGGTATSLIVRQMLHDMESQLRQAMCLTELTANTSDVFHQMIRQSFHWKQYSPARLRWIKAVNRVIIKNHTDRLRARFQAAEDAVEKEKFHRWHKESKQMNRVRILRKTIDTPSPLPPMTSSLKVRLDDSTMMRSGSPGCSGKLTAFASTSTANSPTHRSSKGSSKERRAARETFHHGEELSARRRLAKIDHIHRSPGTATAEECLVAPGAVPTLLDSFYVKSASPARPLSGSHRPYILSDAISRAVAGV